MRRLKKLVTLFLAALMAISCMVMPAMAAAHACALTVLMV